MTDSSSVVYTREMATANSWCCGTEARARYIRKKNFITIMISSRRATRNPNWDEKKGFMWRRPGSLDQYDK